MIDRTAASRVRKYRAAQKADRGIKRVEVQVPGEAVEDIKRLSRRLLAAWNSAAKADRLIQSVLRTINAPRPRPIDVRSFVHCLLTSMPDFRWRPHIEAFFDEVSIEAIHDLVLVELVTFEELYRAARTWRVTDGRNVPWIEQMANLKLAKAAA